MNINRQKVLNETQTPIQKLKRPFNPTFQVVNHQNIRHRLLNFCSACFSSMAHSDKVCVVGLLLRILYQVFLQKQRLFYCNFKHITPKCPQIEWFYSNTYFIKNCRLKPMPLTVKLSYSIHLKQPCFLSWHFDAHQNWPPHTHFK